MSTWTAATIAYLTLACVTFVPVLVAALKRVQLHPGGTGFEDSPFSESGRKKLVAHMTRMRGTLVFWKNQAEKFGRLHFYVLLWTVPVSVLVPILVQSVDDDPWAKALLTVASAHTAILLAVHKALRVDANWRAFRHGESEFYDTYRRMLDRPETFGGTEAKQLSRYFDEVENLRKFTRNAETDNLPTLEQVQSQLKKEAAGGDEPG